MVEFLLLPLIFCKAYILYEISTEVDLNLLTLVVWAILYIMADVRVRASDTKWYFTIQIRTDSNQSLWIREKLEYIFLQFPSLFVYSVQKSTMEFISIRERSYANVSTITFDLNSSTLYRNFNSFKSELVYP